MVNSGSFSSTDEDRTTTSKASFIQQHQPNNNNNNNNINNSPVASSCSPSTPPPPHSSSSPITASRVIVALCKCDLITQQTADDSGDLPSIVERAIEPTPTKTEFNNATTDSNTIIINNTTSVVDISRNNNFIHDDDDDDGIIYCTLPKEREIRLTINDGDDTEGGNVEETEKQQQQRSRIFCSVPLNKVQGILTTLIQPDTSNNKDIIITSNNNINNKRKNSEGGGAGDVVIKPNSLRKILCLYCERTFVNVNLRQKHVERCHSTKQNRRVSSRRYQNNNITTSTPCIYCDRLTGGTEHTLRELYEHLILNHSNRYYACLPCELRFLNSSLLADHNASSHAVDDNGSINQLLLIDNINKHQGINNNEATQKETSCSTSSSSGVSVKLTRSRMQTKSDENNVLCVKIEKYNASSSSNNSKLIVVNNNSDDNDKTKKILKQLRNNSNNNKKKKMTVKSSKIAIKRSKRLQAKVVVESQKNKKRKSTIPRKVVKKETNNKIEQQSVVITKVTNDKSSMSSSSSSSSSSSLSSNIIVNRVVNPYPEFDSYFRVKKITDHSIDNLKISSLTFDDVFDKAFFNRIRFNIQENLLNHIDGKLFENEESESRISNFEKSINLLSHHYYEPHMNNNSNNTNINARMTENYGCELSLNAVIPSTTASMTTLLSTSSTSSSSASSSATAAVTSSANTVMQFGDDPESQIEYGAAAKPLSKKKSQQSRAKNPVVHYKYFTRRKYQASIAEQKENRDLSKLDMWTQYVIKSRQQKIIDDKKSAKERVEYLCGDEYKMKVKRDELNRILDRRGPFEDLKEEASKKAALDKFNSTHNDNSIISHESFTEVRELLNDMLNRVLNEMTMMPPSLSSLVLEKTSNHINNKSITTTVASTSSQQKHHVTAAIETIPSYLNLRRTSTLSSDSEIDKSDKIALICSSQETENFELPTNSVRGKNEKIELTGEWARSRIYICAACGVKVLNIKQLLEHKSIYHQNVWAQHYEFVGNQSELYRNLSIPGLGKVGYIEKHLQSKQWKRSEARRCTKCDKQCNSLGELHRHMLECGGDWTWMLARRKCKYRPYGAKSRRKRRGLIKRLCVQKSEQPSSAEKRTYKKSFEGPRPKPSDADTIQRMLANLPAKRITRKIISLKDGIYNSRTNQQISNNNKSNSSSSSKATTKKRGNNKVMRRNALKVRKENIISQKNNSSSLLDLKKKPQKANNNGNIVNNNRRSLRSLNKVLGSRIIDTNSALMVRRKFKNLKSANKIRQAKFNNVEDDLLNSDETTVMMMNTDDNDKIIGDDKNISLVTNEPTTLLPLEDIGNGDGSKQPKRSSPRIYNNHNKNSNTISDNKNGGKILLPSKTSKMSIKNFFTIRKNAKKQIVETDKNVDVSETTIKGKRKLNVNGQEENVKKNKKEKFGKLVRTLTMRRHAKKVIKVGDEDNTDKTELLLETNDLTNKEKNVATTASTTITTVNNSKRKLRKSFRNVVDKMTKYKLSTNGNNSETILLSQVDGGGSSEDSKNEDTINFLVNTVNRIDDLSLVNYSLSKEDPPIPETIFNLSNADDEKILQAKGELDFDRPDDQDIILTPVIETLQPITVDIPSVPLVAKTTANNNNTVAVVDSISPKSKGKIKKPLRGLNDCIAMLTNKLSRNIITEDSSASKVDSIFNLMSSSVKKDDDNNDDAIGKSACILKVPSMQEYYSNLERSKLDSITKTQIDEETLNNHEINSWNSINDTIEGVVQGNEVEEILPAVDSIDEDTFTTNNGEKDIDKTTTIENCMNTAFVLENTCAALEIVPTLVKSNNRSRKIGQSRQITNTVDKIPLTGNQLEEKEVNLLGNNNNGAVTEKDVNNKVIKSKRKKGSFGGRKQMKKHLEKENNDSSCYSNTTNTKAISPNNKKLYLETNLDDLLHVQEVSVYNNDKTNKIDDSNHSLIYNNISGGCDNDDEPDLLENKIIVVAPVVEEQIKKIHETSDLEDELPLAALFKCNSDSITTDKEDLVLQKCPSNENLLPPLFNSSIHSANDEENDMEIKALTDHDDEPQILDSTKDYLENLVVIPTGVTADDSFLLTDEQLPTDKLNQLDVAPISIKIKKRKSRKTRYANNRRKSKSKVKGRNNGINVDEIDQPSLDLDLLTDNDGVELTQTRNRFKDLEKISGSLSDEFLNSSQSVFDNKVEEIVDFTGKDNLLSTVVEIESVTKSADKDEVVNEEIGLSKKATENRQISPVFDEFIDAESSDDDLVDLDLIRRTAEMIDNRIDDLERQSKELLITIPVEDLSQISTTNSQLMETKEKIPINSFVESGHSDNNLVVESFSNEYKDNNDRSLIEEIKSNNNIKNKSLKRNNGSRRMKKRLENNQDDDFLKINDNNGDTSRRDKVLSDNSIEDMFQDGQEMIIQDLRRSRRNSRKTTSYNENIDDIFIPDLEDVNGLSILNNNTKRKNNKILSNDKIIDENKSNNIETRKLNSDELFDLLKSTSSTNDQIVLSKPPSSSANTLFLNNFDEISNDFKEDDNNFDVFDNILEKSIAVIDENLDDDDTNNKSSSSLIIEKDYGDATIEEIKPKRAKRKRLKQCEKKKSMIIINEGIANQTIDSESSAAIKSLDTTADTSSIISLNGESIEENVKFVAKKVVGKKRQNVAMENVFCDICNKTFCRVDNLIKHKRTLTHIFKLSEIEAKEAEAANKAKQQQLLLDSETIITKSNSISIADDNSVVEINSDSLSQPNPINLNDILLDDHNKSIIIDDDDDDDDELAPPILSPFSSVTANNSSLKLADIINDVLNKPVIDQNGGPGNGNINKHGRFSNIILQNNSTDLTRCKSLGERKSFEETEAIISRTPSSVPSLSPPPPVLIKETNYYEPQIISNNNAGIILEKQITLLQNIIENRSSLNNYIDDISVSSASRSSDQSLEIDFISSKQQHSASINFVGNNHTATTVAVKTVNVDQESSFLKPITQYEEISEDSTHLRCSSYEDQPSRKALNRDEELFLECCSLLKSGSEVSNYSSTKKSSTQNNKLSKILSHLELNRTTTIVAADAVPITTTITTTMDEPDWLENKSLSSSSLFINQQEQDENHSNNHYEESNERISRNDDNTYSRTLQTPLGDHFVENRSDSNTISSNWNCYDEEKLLSRRSSSSSCNSIITNRFDDISKETIGASKNEDQIGARENRSFTFEEVSSDDDDDDDIRMPDSIGKNYESKKKFSNILSKAVETQLNNLSQDCSNNRIPTDNNNMAILNNHETKTNEELSDASTNDSKKLLTKGAMKVFEGLKVSIPTVDLNLDKVLLKNNKINRLANKKTIDNNLKLTTKRNNKSMIKQKLNKIINNNGSSKRWTKSKKNKRINKTFDGGVLAVDHQRLFNHQEEQKQQVHDIYDFEETQDNSDVFTKPDYRSFRTRKGGNDEDEEDEEVATTAPPTLLKIQSEELLLNADSNSFESSVSSSKSNIFDNKSTNSSSSSGSKTNPQNITKNKCMIMGRIFKNAVKSKHDDDDEKEDVDDLPCVDNTKFVEDFVMNCPQESSSYATDYDDYDNNKLIVNNESILDKQRTTKLSEQELDKVFDQLIMMDNAENRTISAIITNSNNIETKTIVCNNNIRNNNKKSTKQQKSRKRNRLNSNNSTDDEFSLNTSRTNKKRNLRKNPKLEDNSINLEQELKECIGVASRKSQRKCTSGKQNVLVEYWSSDESSFEVLLENKPIIAAVVNDDDDDISIKSPIVSLKDDDDDSNECSLIIDEIKESVDDDDVFNSSEINDDDKVLTNTTTTTTTIAPTITINNTDSSSKLCQIAVASNRRKRAAANPLYHWSSSSEDESPHDLIEVKPIRDEVDEDDDDRPVQHGWIVGDSPKKLVTMLAQAKGKKIDVDCVKEQGRKRTGSTIIS